ncbi:CPBP family intramembrane metalloprotease [Flavobacterium sp. D11R37]|uniref:CPBP family intramembrane glutamic endopeptidase n=1 Tax=Flavobacterium coralii TaxID=2838017 RepID=UPI001CA714A3|nr:CPBP family intramembrane glutamic endopeptidase [Flavobacterium coralii]MBY8963474.1 CPBP family intramembrane metalloprotease [Flavobacterium coralii]
MIKETLRDLLLFLRMPDDVQYNVSAIKKVKIFIILFLAKAFIFLLLIYPLLILLNNITDLHHRGEFVEDSLFTLIAISIIAPITEELLFRLVLRRQGLVASIFSEQTWYRVFPLLCRISIVSFAIVHLNNYHNSETLFYILSPLIVLSHFITGCFITFVRVRLSFLYGLLLHSLWNFSAYLLLS